ncbi:MAG: pentapeptide repeat-containing protein [Pseudonocardia sp.]
MRQGRLLLALTLLVSITVAVLTGVVLLLVEPTLSKAEIVKTGGLAGGAVIALYALWLNDRRRRTEEARHTLDTDKVADERFARSVELLGHDAAQVRVGALHALAGLATSTGRYRQTVLDILCAYLRQPFTHPSHPGADGIEDDGPAADCERQVRLTAQTLIADLLPTREDLDAPGCDLDLSRASLEHLFLGGRRIGRFTARGARFHGITRMAAVCMAKPALLTGAAFLGRLDLRDATFDGGLSFQDTTFVGEVAVGGASVATFLTVHGPAPEQLVGALAIADTAVIHGDPASWTRPGHRSTDSGQDVSPRGAVPRPPA